MAFNDVLVMDLKLGDFFRYDLLYRFYSFNSSLVVSQSNTHTSKQRYAIEVHPLFSERS
jgi:hypothetical protein